MPAVSTRIRDRFVSSLKRLTPIIQQQKIRDVSEADTVTLVKDLLSELFGYDKYAELTSEHCIRGTYCDLAVKINDKLVLLIEVKSVGSELDDRHVKQIVDYAANQGVEWVILTNAAEWRLYNVLFAKPIDKRLIAQIDILTLDVRKDATIDSIFPFSKEGFSKGAAADLRDRQDATSRFIVSALLVENDNVLQALRRELRRVVNVLVEDEEVLQVLRNEVIKRDVLEGPQAESAARRVNRYEAKALRASAAKPVITATVDALRSPPKNDSSEDIETT